mmetsp:Transcript_862/g.2247  ORF Transcript_862/g.2247 Transcript_862/m.2247 type:complete len:222 (-) Transcript_862:420-1085(-)
MRPEDVVDHMRYLELSMRPTQVLPCRHRLLHAKGGAMSAVAVRFAWGAESDRRPHPDQCRLVLARLRGLDGVAQRVHVPIAILNREDLPTICLKSRLNILCEGQACTPVDGDAIVIPEGDQLAEAEVPCKGARLVRDALLHATVAHDTIRVVIYQREPRLVVDRCQMGFCCCQADCVRDAHAQGPGCRLDSCCHEVLRVPRRLRAPLPELLYVIDADARVT